MGTCTRRPDPPLTIVRIRLINSSIGRTSGPPTSNSVASSEYRCAVAMSTRATSCTAIGWTFT